MFINCMSIALPVRTENRAVGKSSNPNPNPQLCGVLDVWLHLLPHGALWCFLYRLFYIFIYVLRLMHLSRVETFVHFSVLPDDFRDRYSLDMCPDVLVGLAPSTLWYGLCLNPSCVGRLHSIWAQISYHIVHLSVRQRNSACLRGFFSQIYNRLNLHGAEASGGVLWNTQERRGLIQD